jgi:hypothetical protein
LAASRALVEECKVKVEKLENDLQAGKNSSMQQTRLEFDNDKQLQ